MINYIKKTIDNKLYISESNSIIIKDNTIQYIFNFLLKNYLTNLTSREKITKKIFRYKSKIPIYVDKENLYICIRSYRLENSFYINYHSIISYEFVDNYVIVNFLSNHSMKLRYKYTFLKQLEKCKEIIMYTEKKKLVSLCKIEVI
ncbi:competence protein ComK [Mycoplasmatota bacterium WC30]